MATNSSKAKHTNRKTSDEYVDKCTPFPGEEVHRLLHLQEESRVVGRAFLCTWLESLACCFSDCTVCGNHLQILIPGGWGESIWVLSPKCVLCLREHTLMWLFLGVPFTKGRSCPPSQIGHVCVSVAETSRLAITLQRDQGVTVSSKEALKQMLSVALDSLPPSQRPDARFSGYGHGKDKQNRKAAQFCLFVV